MELATISETMFFPVKMNNSDVSMFIDKQAILFFSSKEACENFFDIVGWPKGVSIAKEEGWHRVIHALSLAKENGAKYIAANPECANVKLGNIDDFIEQIWSTIRSTPLSPLYRLLIVLNEIYKNVYGFPCKPMPECENDLKKLVDLVAKDWKAPARIIKVIPLVKDTLRAVAQLHNFYNLGGENAKLFVHNWLDEFSIWAESELEKKKIIDEINDWIERLKILYKNIEDWLPKDDYKIEYSKAIQPNEELMRKFSILPREIPVLKLYKNNEHMTFIPNARWIVGAKCRLDIITKKNQYILVDVRSLEKGMSDWKIVVDDVKKGTVIFNKEQFLKILKRM